MQKLLTLLILLRNTNHEMKATVFAKGIQMMTWKSAFLSNGKTRWTREVSGHVPFITTMSMFFLKCFFSCLHLLRKFSSCNILPSWKLLDNWIMGELTIPEMPQEELPRLEWIFHQVTTVINSCRCSLNLHGYVPHWVEHGCIEAAPSCAISPVAGCLTQCA